MLSTTLWVFHLFTLLEHSSQTCPEVCVFGNFKSSQCDSDDQSLQSPRPRPGMYSWFWTQNWSLPAVMLRTSRIPAVLPVAFLFHRTCFLCLEMGSGLTLLSSKVLLPHITVTLPQSIPRSHVLLNRIHIVPLYVTNVSNILVAFLRLLLLKLRL